MKWLKRGTTAIKTVTCLRCSKTIRRTYRNVSSERSRSVEALVNEVFSHFHVQKKKTKWHTTVIPILEQSEHLTRRILVPVMIMGRLLPTEPRQRRRMVLPRHPTVRRPIHHPHRMVHHPRPTVHHLPPTDPLHLPTGRHRSHTVHRPHTRTALRHIMGRRSQYIIITTDHRIPSSLARLVRIGFSTNLSSNWIFSRSENSLSN